MVCYCIICAMPMPMHMCQSLQVTASIDAGIKNATVFNPSTPPDVILYLKNVHNEYHKGADRAWYRVLLSIIIISSSSGSSGSSSSSSGSSISTEAPTNLTWNSTRTWSSWWRRGRNTGPSTTSKWPRPAAWDPAASTTSTASTSRPSLV